MMTFPFQYSSDVSVKNMMLEGECHHILY
jgi:hypothetical protein